MNRTSFVRVFVLASTILFLRPSISSAAFITAKCLTPLSETIIHVKGGEAVKRFIPVECQYYRFSDLDETTQKNVRELLGKKGSEISAETKLSSLMGSLFAVAESSMVTTGNDPCSPIRDKFLDTVETVKTRDGCQKLLGDAILELRKTEKCGSVLAEMKDKGQAKCNAVGNKISF